VHTDFASLFKDLVLPDSTVSRLSNLRRSTALFSPSEFADSLFFIEDGLVKLTKTTPEGGRIIQAVYGPNDIFGEESMSSDSMRYQAEAEVLTTSAVVKVPAATVQELMTAHPHLSLEFVRYLLKTKAGFAHQVELHCLYDVEYRIIYYLEQLAKLVRPAEDGSVGRSLPITQLELADLVGATRETTSTTLNALERRGLVKLSRRLLTVYLPLSKFAVAGDPT
jgi:CRP-like cAMP-binding protein